MNEAQCSPQAVEAQPKMSPLRARMFADMQARGFHPQSQKAYVRAVVAMVRHCGNRRPEEIPLTEAQAYLRELKAGGETPSLLANARAGVRFLYEVTLGQVWHAVSALRRRMIEDMDLRGFSLKTQASYVRSVADLGRYFNQSPARLSEEQIRQYFVHLKVERKLARPTVTIALCGIKFFYEQTLKRDWSLTGVPRPKREHKLPVVLARPEVDRILGAVREPRLKAVLTLIYACGLRLGEGCHLAPTDIDSARGLIHIRGAKGGADRYVPIARILEDASQPALALPLRRPCRPTRRPSRQSPHRTGHRPKGLPPGLHDGPHSQGRACPHAKT
jgi:integrase